MNTKSEIASSDLLIGIVPFVKSEKEDDMSRTVEYRVHGFWGNFGYLKIYQFRSLKTGAWLQVDISWSSGGRDIREQPCDMKATMCFALALQDAVEHATKMTEKAVTE